MYGLTTIHKLNREAAEAAAILAKYGEQKGSPNFDALLAEYRKEQAEKEGTGIGIQA